jgi:hypothetical protein
MVNFKDLSPKLHLAVRLDNGTRLDVEYRRSSEVKDIVPGQILIITGLLSNWRILASAIKAMPHPEQKPLIRQRLGAAASETLRGGGSRPSPVSPSPRTLLRILALYRFL